MRLTCGPRMSSKGKLVHVTFTDNDFVATVSHLSSSTKKKKDSHE